LEKVETVIIEVMKTKTALGEGGNGHHRGYEKFSTIATD